MAKSYGLCELCKIPRMLNYARLCKKCNNKKEGGVIASEKLEQASEDLAVEQKMQAAAMEAATASVEESAKEETKEKEEETKEEAPEKTEAPAE